MKLLIVGLDGLDLDLISRWRVSWFYRDTGVDTMLVFSVISIHQFYGDVSSWV